jgi:tetratricopeptide (TPR) repeat protein
MRPSHKSIFAAGTQSGFQHGLATAWALVMVASPASLAAEGQATGPAAAPAAGPTAAPAPQSTTASAAESTTNPPVERILLKPGKSLSISMATEDIVCTNDVNLAAKQRESYPDSPEASFIYAVALSRSSRVEDALREVRRARRLAEKQGGPSYFDKMIDTYEQMLTYYPDDNQVRYHLAWAYYMKAYVLAKYSHLANTPQAKYKEWVAQATKPQEADTKIGEADTKAGETSATTNAGETATTTNASDAAGSIKQDDGNDVLKNIQKASSTISSASPQAIPQVQKYYGLATAKLDDLLSRDPSDVWARVYRAYLKAEAGGDLVTAMAEWQKVKDEHPTNPAAYFFLGEGYLKQGNLKECLGNVSKAVALRAIGN